MGRTDRFIEEPSETSEVLRWFRALPQPPHEHKTDQGVVLYFREMGPLVHDANGEVDANKCPVVNLFLPQVRRSILWTVGEVHVLATPLRKLFPELQKVSTKFSRWLSSHECVFASTAAENPFDYFFEGTVRNFDVPIYALGSGLEALRAGRYFVDGRDNEAVLNRVCRTLKLRGVDCGEP